MIPTKMNIATKILNMDKNYQVMSIENFKKFYNSINFSRNYIFEEDVIPFKIINEYNNDNKFISFSIERNVDSCFVGPNDCISIKPLKIFDVSVLGIKEPFSALLIQRIDSYVYNEDDEVVFRTDGK